MQATRKDARKDPSDLRVAPKEMMPTGISSQDDAAEERQGRNIAAGESMLHKERLLDEAIEATFPASDPTAELPISPAAEQAAHCDDCDEDLLDEAIALTFPASDPIAVTLYRELRPSHTPVRIG